MQHFCLFRLLLLQHSGGDSEGKYALIQHRTLEKKHTQSDCSVLEILSVGAWWERLRGKRTDGRLRDCRVTPCRWWAELQAGPSVTERHGNNAAGLFGVSDCEARCVKCLHCTGIYSIPLAMNNRYAIPGTSRWGVWHIALNRRIVSADECTLIWFRLITDSF